MTQNQEPTVENFFDNVGGGGAPSAKLSDIGDWVSGEIVDQRTVDYIPFGKEDPEVNKDGSIRKQLVVTLQTDWRDWVGVSKIPLVDKDDASKGYKDPSEDDGRRTVYLPQWSNIQKAVADSILPTNGGRPGPLRNGGTLSVKVADHKDTGKGNPLKIHAAQYVAPAASAGFFDNTAQSAPAAPTPPPAPAAPQAPAAPTPPPVPAQQAAPAAPAQDPWDPWATPAATPSTTQPPF